jgi:putative acetyltransferase
MDKRRATKKFFIRRLKSQDQAPLTSLYPAAFPDEDLLPLVRNLLKLNDDDVNYDGSRTIVSLVATTTVGDDSRVVGSIFFSMCSVDQGPTTCTETSPPPAVALLGPLAVHPTSQKQGIGSALVKEGIRQLADQATMVLVLGDPSYYGRFGFSKESDVQPPYTLPDEWASAWQSLDTKKYINGDLENDIATGEAQKTAALVENDGNDTINAFIGKLTVPAPWQEKRLWS